MLYDSKSKVTVSFVSSMIIRRKFFTEKMNVFKRIGSPIHV